MQHKNEQIHQVHVSPDISIMNFLPLICLIIHNQELSVELVQANSD